jgi:hypothetical protein
MRSIELVAASALLFAACGGGSAIGEACSQEADTDECVDGAVCAKAKSGDLECMKLCARQEDCSAGTECTGTTSSAKVCQAK